MNRTTLVCVAVSAGGLLSLTGSASAFLVNGSYFDTPDCDNHGPQTFYEELGNAPMFPLDELIDSQTTTVTFPSCPPTDDGTPSQLVSITNLSGQSWSNLYYVADPDTKITNVDGLAISAAAPGVTGLAFRIDQLGIHRSLIAESMTLDGIFEPGETWEIHLQNYFHPAGISAAALGSLDFAGASTNNPLSSGSIVAAVPEPGALALAGMAGIGMLRRRRN